MTQLPGLPRLPRQDMSSSFFALAVALGGVVIFGTPAFALPATSTTSTSTTSSSTTASTDASSSGGSWWPTHSAGEDIPWGPTDDSGIPGGPTDPNGIANFPTMPSVPHPSNATVTVHSTTLLTQITHTVTSTPSASGSSTPTPIPVVVVDNYEDVVDKVMVVELQNDQQAKMFALLVKVAELLEAHPDAARLTARVVAMDDDNGQADANDDNGHADEHDDSAHHAQVDRRWIGFPPLREENQILWMVEAESKDHWQQICERMIELSKAFRGNEFARSDSDMVLKAQQDFRDNLAKDWEKRRKRMLEWFKQHHIDREVKIGKAIMQVARKCQQKMKQFLPLGMVPLNHPLDGMDPPMPAHVISSVHAMDRIEFPAESAEADAHKQLQRRDAPDENGVSTKDHGTNHMLAIAVRHWCTKAPANLRTGLKSDHECKHVRKNGRMEKRWTYDPKEPPPKGIFMPPRLFYLPVENLYDAVIEPFFGIQGLDTFYGGAILGDTSHNSAYPVSAMLKKDYNDLV